MKKPFAFLGWALAAFFLLTGLAGLIGLNSPHRFAAIVFILWGVLLLPPTWQRYRLRDNVLGRLAIVLVSIFVVGSVAPRPQTPVVQSSPAIVAAASVSPSPMIASSVLPPSPAAIVASSSPTPEFSPEPSPSPSSIPAPGGSANAVSPSPSPVAIAQSNCDPSYPDFCIAPAPPDLDCKSVGRKNFTVLQPDPHKFDRDKDGVGCESKR